MLELSYQSIQMPATKIEQRTILRQATRPNDDHITVCARIDASLVDETNYAMAARGNWKDASGEPAKHVRTLLMNLLFVTW